MKRSEIKKIAETITNIELLDMFNRVKQNAPDWTKTSKVNKGMTIGSTWNVLTKDFNIDKEYHILAKMNMVREFGEWLPEELKPKKEPKNKNKNPMHQEPKLNNI